MAGYSFVNNPENYHDSLGGILDQPSSLSSEQYAEATKHGWQTYEHSRIPSTRSLEDQGLVNPNNLSDDHTIYFADINGTLLDTSEADRRAHAKALNDAFEDRDVSAWYEELGDSSIDDIVRHYGLNSRTYAEEHYEPWDPREAAENGWVRTYDDAESFVEEHVVLTVANGSTQAAWQTLCEQSRAAKHRNSAGHDEVSVLDNVGYVHGESGEGAKPDPGMGVAALEAFQAYASSVESLNIAVVGDSYEDEMFATRLSNELYPVSSVEKVLCARLDRGGTTRRGRVKSLDDKLIHENGVTV